MLWTIIVYDSEKGSTVTTILHQIFQQREIGQLPAREMVPSVTHLTTENKCSEDATKRKEFFLSPENSLRWILSSILLQVKNNSLFTQRKPIRKNTVLPLWSFSSYWKQSMLLNSQLHPHIWTYYKQFQSKFFHTCVNAADPKKETQVTTWKHLNTAKNNPDELAISPTLPTSTDS